MFSGGANHTTTSRGSLTQGQLGRNYNPGQSVQAIAKVANPFNGNQWGGYVRLMTSEGYCITACRISWL